jgi:multimeric flavodoxin WrbA
MTAKKGKLKIIGISGSPREGNTNYMLRAVLDAAGGDCESILLKDKKIKPCTACGGCFKTHKCVVADDMRELYDKLLNADVIVLACPTYFANVTALMKAFMDRCLPLYLSEKLKGKKVALLAGGNFKKGEVRFLDDFDIDQEMKDPTKRKALVQPVQRCLNIMKYFCVAELQMTLLGTVAAINGDATSKTKKLAELGKKLSSY